MRRLTAILLLALVVAGCGSGGLEGSLAWQSGPAIRAHVASGVIRNTTGHSVDLDPHAMRLLDANGRKVAGHFGLGATHLPAHATTTLSVTWKSGKPVRIDYGSGALRLTSG